MKNIEIGQAVKNWYFWAPQWPNYRFSGMTNTANFKPTPKLGWYQVSLKSLEPFMQVSKITDFGQNFQTDPSGEEYKRTRTVLKND